MFQFIITHINDIITAITSIIAGASALAALTPTPKDDRLLGKIKTGLNLVALNVGNAKPA